ncbi:MAG: hypothetical protein LBG74_02720 [Spirochaetaceae bacterium]|jgi:hypothetical protein|nr:hypothetical protein [Spirochaetaceae bacterium]
MAAGLKQPLSAAVIALNFIFAAAANAQNAAAPSAMETPADASRKSYQNPASAGPFELLALRLPELFQRFGPPVAVYAARGEYDWQDDVVFEYPGVNFYLYKDQVWQVSLTKAFGLSCGDPEKAVTLVFKNAVLNGKDIFTVTFNEFPWPAELRINIIKGKVDALYLYKVNY